MNDEIGDAVESGILTPASQLRINDEDEENYRDGFVFEKTQEILTRGHVLSSVTRVDNVKLRAQAAEYVISPTKFKFVKTIRITAIVFKFLRSFKCLKSRFTSDSKDPKFDMFPIQSANSSIQVLML